MSVLRVFAAAAAVLFLAACGGGSGGTSVVSPASTPAQTVNEFRAVVYSAAPQIVPRVIVPEGGIVRSTDRSVSGVDTSHRNGEVTATIRRTGTADTTLSTQDTYQDFGITSSIVGLPGRSSRTRYVFDRSSSSATVGLIAADWSRADPNDYLAGGYWAHQRILSSGQSAIEFGAFVDGPELSGSRPALPASGTASYRGRAAGMYAAEFGSDGGAWQGDWQVGEFDAIATLTANFSNNTVSGCIGCAAPVTVLLSYYDSSERRLLPVSRDTITNRLELGATPINRSSGTFGSSNVRLAGGLLPVVSTQGSWSGKFSNRVSGSDPRLAAGTFAAEGRTAGGSEGVLIGAFAAGKR